MQILNLKSKILSRENGFIFLEIVIAIALIGTVFITLLGIGFSSVNVSSAIQKQTRADSLMKEEFEAIRSLRDSTTWGTNGLGTVAVGSANPYYMFLDTTPNPDAWILQAGTETAGIFTRKVVFDKVSRDPSTQNIESVYNASHNDPDTVKATVTVAWLGKTSEVAAYFTNWKK